MKWLHCIDLSVLLGTITYFGEISFRLATTEPSLEFLRGNEISKAGVLLQEPCLASEEHVTMAAPLLWSFSWADQPLEPAPLLADLEDRSRHCCREHRDSQAQ